MKTFQNKKIIITGATGGIGKPLLDIIANDGVEIFLISSNLENMEKLSAKIKSKNAKCQFFKADLASEEGILNAANFISKINNPDMLINLAGISYFGSLGCQNFSEIKSLYNLNLLAPTILTQSVLPQMTKRNCGKIVNIGSIFGSISFPFFATYCASKSGLRGFSESLRRELSSTEIKVLYIAPRAVKTKINHGAVEEFLIQTKTAIDEPELVAKKIVQAIQAEKKYSYFGFPESLFVRINYLIPKLLDCGLKAKTQLAAKILLKNKSK